MLITLVEEHVLTVRMCEGNSGLAAERYASPLVGEMRKHHFDGTSLRPANYLKTRRLPRVGFTLCWAAIRLCVIE